MMKVYSQSIIHAIQNVINTGKIELNTYKDYSFFNIINSAELIVRAYIDPKTNRRDCMLIINNSDIPSKFVSDWKTSAPGKFLCKDFKKDNRDFIGNTLYHELKITVNGEPIKILVRLLNEITNPELKESEKQEYIANYGDITIDGKYFSVIKIVNDNERDSWGSWDRYKSKEHIIDVVYPEAPYIDEVDSDEGLEEAENIEDDSMSSDPLF